MEFVESATFTAWVIGALGEEEYRHLQTLLSKRPDAGAVIPGSGGLRKIRWASRGRGKRGGCRIIYHWNGTHTIEFVVAYEKGRKDNLSAKELKILRDLLR